MPPGLPLQLLFVLKNNQLESHIRRLLREVGSRTEWHAAFVNSATQAIATLKNNLSFDIVFTELDLPGKDGLFLLEFLQTAFPLTTSVLFSSGDDYQAIRGAMNRGAFDFLPIPLDPEDFKHTFKKVLQAALSHKKSISEHDELITLEQEFEIARRIQLSVSSNHDSVKLTDQRFELSGYSKPARIVGGDFYDFFCLDDHQLGFVIGDVASRGLPAALFMAVCRTLIRSLALQGYPPDHCLRQVNKILYRESDPSLFIAVFYGILDLQSGEIRYSNGGHTYPYLVDAQGKVQHLNNPGGMVLGVLETAAYQVQRYLMKRGDLIFLYTDGLLTLYDEKKGRTFETHIRNFLSVVNKQRTAVTSISDLFNEIVRSENKNQPEDDLTGLAIRYNGPIRTELS